MYEIQLFKDIKNWVKWQKNKFIYSLCSSLITVYPSAIDSESLKPLSVLHSGLKREW